MRCLVPCPQSEVLKWDTPMSKEKIKHLTSIHDPIHTFLTSALTLALTLSLLCSSTPILAASVTPTLPVAPAPIAPVVQTGATLTARLATPTLLWNKDFKVIGNLGLAGEDLLFIGKDSKLRRVGPDGLERWSFPLGDLGRAGPVVAPSGRIYAVAYDDTLYALSSQGKLIWKTRLDADLFASPALLEDEGVITASAKGKVTAWGPDGKQRWEFQAAGGVFSSPVVSSAGDIYFGCQDGKLYALDSSGKLKWSFQAGSTLFSSAALDLDGTIYIGSSDKKLYALSSAGELKWSYATGGFINASPIISAEGLIVVGSFDKSLYALERSGKLAWKTDLGSSLAAPAVQLENGDIVLGSYAGKLFALSPKGAINWQLEGFAKLDTSVTVSAAGNLYVGAVDGVIKAFKGEPPIAQGVWSYFRNLPSGGGRSLTSSELTRLKPRLDASTGKVKDLPVLVAVAPNPPAVISATTPATPVVPVIPPATLPVVPPLSPINPVVPVVPPSSPINPPAAPPTKPVTPPSSPVVPAKPLPTVPSKIAPVNFAGVGEKAQVRDGTLYLPLEPLYKTLGYLQKEALNGKLRLELTSGGVGNQEDSGWIRAYLEVGGGKMYVSLNDFLELPGMSGLWNPQNQTLFLQKGARVVSVRLELLKLRGGVSLPTPLRPVTPEGGG